jgi:hypothetical protein
MTDDAYFHAKYDYDPVTGLLTTKFATNCYGGRKPAGSVAGAVEGNRIVLHINRDGKQRVYKAHRVIWLMQTGQWPDREIDHIDVDGTNNAWSNLRLSTSSQNKWNQKVQTSASGLKGVQRRKNGRCWAKITANYKRICLSTYDTTEAAFAACCEARIKYHGGFARFA